MKLSAKEAKELMPNEYMPTDKICERIQLLAKAGIDYLWTDLTKGQVEDFRVLGYKIDDQPYERKYKISWK